MGSNRQDSKIRTLKTIGMACITLSVFLLSGCGNKRDGLTITNVSCKKGQSTWNKGLG